MREADLVGAAYLGVALGGIVLAFATADPEVSVFSPLGPWLLLASAAAVVALVVHLRRAADPLVPRGTLAATPAWGSLVVSLLVGWALIAALVDIPLLARTQEGRTQLEAAFFLLRFLVALPLGAVLGGALLRRFPAGLLTAAGMVLAAAAFQWMSGWDRDSLDAAVANVPLVAGGLGFGLALAPVNAAMLATTRADTHGVASALVVAARMIGMLVGISVLTTWGLRQVALAIQDDPSLREDLRAAAVLQEQAVFQGAAIVALLAALVALVALPRSADPRCQPAGRAAHRRLTRYRSPVAAFDDLISANAAYAASFTEGGFDGIARAGVGIVTCMDSRIEPLVMLGLELGDAKILRTPGGRVDHTTLEALVLGVHLLGVERILLIAHTRCAVASKSTEEILAQIESSSGQDASWLDFEAVSDQLEALADDVQKLRTHPLVPRSTVVGGFIYDVDTGRIEQKY